MATKRNRELASFVKRFLLSLRRSIERPSNYRRLHASVDQDAILLALLLIEEARFKSDFSGIAWNSVTNEEIELSLIKVVEILDRIYSDERMTHIMSSRLTQGLPSHTNDYENKELYDIIPHRSEEIDIGAALMNVMRYIREFDFKAAGSQGTLSLSDIDRLVPPQQIAPVKFEFRSGKLSVLQDPPELPVDAAETITPAKEHIVDSGERLIEDLKGSNCDRRLVQAIENVHALVKNDGNIVKVGLAGMSAAAMMIRFSEEYSSAISGMLTSYAASISMYAAQFPEWEKFLERSVLVDIDDEAASSLVDTTERLISDLAKEPDIVDQSVPKSIKFVLDLISSPGPTSKKAIFALIKTIENLAGSVFIFGKTFIESTSSVILQKGPKAAGNAVLGLVYITILSAIDLSSFGIGSAWMHQAAEILKNALKIE